MEENENQEFEFLGILLYLLMGMSALGFILFIIEQFELLISN